jgi:hypothetical protein
LLLYDVVSDLCSGFWPTSCSEDESRDQMLLWILRRLMIS